MPHYPAPTMFLILGFVALQSMALGNESPRLAKLLRQGGADERDAELFSQSGQAFAKVLPHLGDGEVALMAATVIPVPLDFFIARFRDIENFRRGPEVMSDGRFGHPPQERDFENLRLENKELESLSECRPGKCSLKLSADMMKTLRSGAAGRAGNPGLEPAFRNVLFNYLNRFRGNGSAAMIAYADRDPPVQSSREFLALLGQFPWLKTYSPELFDALTDSPHRNHPAVEESFYWSKDDLGLKPIVTITQVLIATVTIDGKRWMVAASKQIYADHYLEASVGLTLVADQSTDAAHPGIAVVYLNRTKTDGLRGWLASIQRAIVERRARAGLAERLSAMRDNVTQAYRNRRPM